MVFKNSRRGGVWERSCRKLRFNISQVRATDSHRRTQLSLILIKSGCVCAPPHRQAAPLWIGNWMGNEPSSVHLWNMFFPRPTLLFIWCVLSFGLYLCCHINLSICFCLSLSSQRAGSGERPVDTEEQESPPEEGLSALVLTQLFLFSF